MNSVIRMTPLIGMMLGCYMIYRAIELTIRQTQRWRMIVMAVISLVFSALIAIYMHALSNTWKLSDAQFTAMFAPTPITSAGPDQDTVEWWLDVKKRCTDAVTSVISALDE